MCPSNISTQMILDQLSTYIFWKDKTDKIVGGNKLFIKAAGFDCIADIRGKSDFEMPWAQFAEEYQRIDTEVLRGYHLNGHCELQRQASGEVVKVIVNKTPIYNKRKKILGLVGSYIITNSKIADRIAKLPPRQKECLQLLIDCRTIKQIAHKMQLSSRTIEFYLSIIKNKFQCKSKAALIKKTCRYI